MAACIAAAGMAASARATTSKVTLETFSPSIARGLRRPIRSKPSHRNSFFHSSSALCTSFARTQSSHEVSSSIRSLMRGSAQPVALVTTLLPPTKTQIHAATLSSFTSISLEPNLVCFSIKTPSKLADALAWHVSQRKDGGGGKVDFVINVLSSSQAVLAAAYATPGTPPLDLSTAAEQEGGEEHPLRRAGVDELQYGDKDTVTVVQGSVGSLACSVVESVDLEQFGNSDGEVDTQEVVEGECKTSKLYIARVVHVHSPTTSGDDAKGQDRIPLVYHRQKFVTATETALTEA